jgi:hypothetical protein
MQKFQTNPNVSPFSPPPTSSLPPPAKSICPVAIISPSCKSEEEEYIEP